MVIRNISVLLLSLFVLTGCITAHKYSPTGTGKFRNGFFAGKTFSVEKIDILQEKKNEINNPRVRLAVMSSPYSDSYAEYLRRALVTELVESQKYSDNSDLVISGKLLKNEITSPVTENGRMTISANIIVKNKGKIIFEKVVSRDEVWRVSLFGDTTRDRAKEAYVKAMNKYVELVFQKIDWELN